MIDGLMRRRILGGLAAISFLFSSALAAQQIHPANCPLDINRATIQQLADLPGIGPTFAARIIAHRPYSSRLQLLQHGILPRDVYTANRDCLTAKRLP
jgi:DNA uptake protein ComE-like DNA-binding protein